LVELFEKQVVCSPEAVAVLAEGTCWSFGELDAEANRVAHFLIERGVGPERSVALLLPRSARMVAAILGVLKAGAAYVPIDADHPAERIAYMLADSRPAVVLGGEGGLVLDDLASYPAASPRIPVSPHHPAYVIYTSGSTGTPKGVVVPHAGVVNRLAWMQAEYCLRPDDRVLQKTPIGFDVSVWELFWPLITCAGLVVARPGGHRDPAYLIDVIEREEVTTVHFVPSMLRAFLADLPSGRCETLRRVVCSGEALPAEVVESFYSRLSAPLHNLYGQTEATVDVTY
jgi:non-ribosomal peptide synthetase component F